MKKIILVIIILFIILMFGFGKANQSHVKIVSADAVTGVKPEVFLPGLVSTDEHEFSSSFSPDGKEFYFARATGKYMNKKILRIRRIGNGNWSTPETAIPEFKDENFEPHISINGKHIYFMGFTRVFGQNRPDMDVYCAEKVKGEWTRITRLPGPFNPGNAMFISVTRGGTLYTANREQNSDIVLSRFENGNYLPYERLPAPVNSEYSEGYPFISPDEDFLLFNSWYPEGRILLVSFKQQGGRWSAPQKIVLGMTAGCPMVSPDGKYLFFNSGDRPMRQNIYRVDSQVFKKLRKNITYSEVEK